MQHNIIRTVVALTAMLATCAEAQTKYSNFWLSEEVRNLPADDASEKLAYWIDLPAETTLQLVADETDNLGMRHQQFRQYVGGAEVAGSIIKVHSRGGLVCSVNGYAMRETDAPTQLRTIKRTASGSTTDAGTPVLLQKADGFGYALRQKDFLTGDIVYVDADTKEELKRLPAIKNTAETTVTAPTFYYGSRAFQVSTRPDGTYILTDSTRHIYTIDAGHPAKDDLNGGFIDWKTSTTDRKGYIEQSLAPFSTTDGSNWRMKYLKAITVKTFNPGRSLPGERTHILFKLTDKTGSEYYTSKAFSPTALPQTISFGEHPFLFDKRYDLVIYACNEKGGNQFKFMTMSTKIDPCSASNDYSEGTKLTLTAETGETASPATDAHWGMQQTFDFYKNTLGRTSYDNKSAAIYNIIFPTPSDQIVGMDQMNNAQANSQYDFPVMIYGTGDGKTYKPFVCIETLAHEFTHLVIGKTADLEYKGEPGALNESFADIVGNTVKQQIRGKEGATAWLIGDEMAIPGSGVTCLRDMRGIEQGSSKTPLYYKGENWVDTSGKTDNGGVHDNSAVQNRWYYILCNEGENEYTDKDGNKVKVNGIGTEKGIQIAYRSMATYLTSTSQYADAVKGSLLAATDLYGQDSAEATAVKLAWKCVGLDSDSTDGITNATTSKQHAATANIYTLSGTRLKSTDINNLPAGIYIQAGKKITVR